MEEIRNDKAYALMISGPILRTFSVGVIKV